jgi:trehalose 6-phosphate synthase/phosphatase
MVVVPSRDFIDKYREMKKEIESVVGRINGRYSTLTWMPLIYNINHCPLTNWLPFTIWATWYYYPLRDGMNLLPKNISPANRKYRILVLSEMAGAAAELNESILLILPTIWRYRMRYMLPSL